jgi:fermentation-respiration switch protein FrsA (DUF1100 family)
VLRGLSSPILFVQGTRDPLCPLDALDGVRERMTAPNALVVVDEGDHSLVVTKRWLHRHGKTQDDVDQAILAAVARFLDEHAARRPPAPLVNAGR